MYKSTIRLLTASIPLSLLMACDPGQQSLDKLLDSQGDVLKSGITSANLMQVQTLALGLEIIQAAHPQKASGIEAAKKLGDIKKMAEDRLLELGKQAGTVGAEVQRTAEDHMKLVKELKRDIEKTKPHSAFNQDPFNAGDCVAVIDGSEFDQRPDIFRVQIDKVAKEGKSEYLLQTLYHAQEDDIANPDAKLTAPAREQSEHKNLMLAYRKVSCARAEKVQESYNSILKKAKDFGPLKQQIEVLRGIAQTK